MIFGCSAFLLFGGLLVLVGALQAELAGALGIGLRDTGLLGATLVLGIGTGILAAGPAIDRRPGRPLFVASAAFTGAALLGVASDMTMGRAVVHVFAAGLGAGFYETVLNTTAVARHGDQAVRRIAFMHSAATLGAMLSPIAIALWVARDGGFVGAFRVLGAGHLALALWGARTSALAGEPLPHEATTARDARQALRRVLSHGPLVALLVASFFYVGVETSVTLFAVPFASEHLGLAAERGQSGISAFWLGLLAMRLAVVAAPRPTGAGMIAAAGGAAALLLGASVSLSLPWIEALLGLTGFAIGALFPLFIALAGRLAPEARGTSVAVVSGLGSAGGFVLPWLLGTLGDAHGAGAVFAGIAAACAVVCAAGVALLRSMRGRGAGPA